MIAFESNGLTLKFDSALTLEWFNIKSSDINRMNHLYLNNIIFEPSKTKLALFSKPGVKTHAGYNFLELSNQLSPVILKIKIDPQWIQNRSNFRQF